MTGAFNALSAAIWRRQWTAIRRASVAAVRGTIYWTLVARKGTQGAHRRGDVGAVELRGTDGEPWWDRTTDPLIKSQVLCQLS